SESAGGLEGPVAVAEHHADGALRPAVGRGEVGKSVAVELPHHHAARTDPGGEFGARYRRETGHCAILEGLHQQANWINRPTPDAAPGARASQVAQKRLQKHGGLLFDRRLLATGSDNASGAQTGAGAVPGRWELAGGKDHRPFCLIWINSPDVSRTQQF